MNNYQQQFKNDIFSGIVDLVKAIWQPIFIAYVVYFAYSKVLSYGFMKILGYKSLEEFTASYSAIMLDQERMMEWIEELKDTIMRADVIGIAIGAVIVYMLIMSWNYLFSYKVAEKEITEGSASLGEVLKSSLSTKLIGLIGLSILIMLVMWGAMILAILLSVASSVFFLIILLPAVFYLGLKFALAFPAYAVGDYSFKDSIAFSFKHLTFVRILKMIAIGLGIFIGLMVLTIVFGQIVQLLKSVAIVYIGLKYMIEFISGGIMMAIIAAAFTGLYYRYETSIDGFNEFSIEDNLVDDDY